MNEDRFVCDCEVGLFAVADGMGGHKAGQVAAQLATDTIAGFINRSLIDNDITWPYGIDDKLSYDGPSPDRHLSRKSESVSRRRKQRRLRRHGRHHCWTVSQRRPRDGGSVGDSRVYLFANGNLEQLTADDSWAAMILAQDPKLRPEDLATHPMRNVLTNVLGGKPTVEVHLLERELSGGETLLLCSDGLHGALSRDVLQETVTNTADPERAAQKLVDMALAAGSRDNVTAVVVRYEADK
jgi:protein phosphatase